MENKAFRNLMKSSLKVLNESLELDELEKKTLIDYKNKAGAQVASDLYTDTGKHTPKTNRRARGVIKAKARLLAPEELAISPERLADTRKNIEKYIKSKEKKESVELDEGKMSEIDARRKEGQTPAQIAKGMNVDVEDIKGILNKVEKKPTTEKGMLFHRIDKLRKRNESVELDEFQTPYDQDRY